ncbi:MAG: DUF4145 domain-containing protein [Fibrobacterota bacterium]|nr:MAG: DUF4145 domain-containing protein [Fibrobacterota bacterium]
MKKGEILKSQCRECKRSTNHKVLELHIEDGKLEDEVNNTFDFHNQYSIVKCMGCDCVSYISELWDSEMLPDQDGVALYPESHEQKRGIYFREPLSWDKAIYIPDRIKKVYKEVINTFNDKSHLLCSVGIRAVIEAICVEKNITEGPIEIPSSTNPSPKTSTNLQAKINGLASKGLLSPEHAEILHEHRFLGNEAVHEFTHPNRDVLSLAIDIIEHTFDNLFEIPEKGKEIKAQRTKKAKTKKKKTKK